MQMSVVHRKLCAEMRSNHVRSVSECVCHNASNGKNICVFTYICVCVNGGGRQRLNFLIRDPWVWY